jgi:poly(A) polymerase Pap1
MDEPVSQQDRPFGVTQPISLTHPTPRELQLSASLEQLLAQHKLYESDEERDKRVRVLGRLDKLGREARVAHQRWLFRGHGRAGWRQDLHVWLIPARRARVRRRH